MFKHSISTVAALALGVAALPACDDGEDDSSAFDEAGEIEDRDGAAWIETFSQAGDDYAHWSNAVCQIPYFTTSYNDVVEAHSDSAYSGLFEAGYAIARDNFIADLTGAALAEFGGPSPLTHGQWVTKAIDLSHPVSSADILKAIQKLPAAEQALLNAIQKSLGLSSKESAMRVVAVQAGLYRGLGNFLGALGTKIPVPPVLGNVLGQLASAASQTLNAIGFVGIFCTGANTLAGLFEALEWTARAGASAQQSESWEDDACARLNSNKQLFGKGCKFEGALANFDNNGNTKCKQFVVDSSMNLGLKFHGDKHMGYGIFRVGAGKKLDYLTSVRLPNGFIVAKVRVNDPSAANNTGVGWTYVGGLKCL